MRNDEPVTRPGLTRAAGKPKGLRLLALTAVLASLGAMAPGCLDRPLEPQETRLTSTIVERLTQSSVDKIDILLVIDNSRSMADKQEILRAAVPDLVLQLVNPKCICETAMQGLCEEDEPLPDAQQPTDPLAECPPGTKREFDPILDFHLGVITSSVGGHGSDACVGDLDPSENDHGYLIDRDATGSMGGTVETWLGKKFLVWDPEGTTHDPAGENNADTLNANLADMVSGAGEVGCGYEAILEAWYRFLIDPDPYETITLEQDANGNPNAVLQGEDETLKTMRQDFMRPDSLMAIIMLSDENDCSIRDGGQYFFASQRYTPGTTNSYHLPKPRAACATNPNDPCCRSCGQGPGCLEFDSNNNCVKQCDTSQDVCDGALSGADDQLNLRCFDQKRRFGIDFLYPIARYVQGVTAPQVPDRGGQLVNNPLFSAQPDDPNDAQSAVRDSGLVFVAGIVGVPWQDISRKNDAGQPDLTSGLNLAKEPVGGFQDANELVQNKTWELILGDPGNYVNPTDPFMIESVGMRSGANPVTGDMLPGSNNINGNDYTIADNADLQYACIFDLPTAKDCSSGIQCDCDGNHAQDNPLCDAPGSTTQIKAKGYPGLRELNVLKNVGTQGIVGSICPAQLDNPTLQTYGYRPAINAIVERLKQALGGKCLPRSLTPNNEGQVPCIILEARRIGDGGASCEPTCSGTAGRRFIEQDHPAVTAAKEDPLYTSSQWDCFCEIVQTTGEDLTACQNDESSTPQNASGQAVNGWCYVDAASVPPLGNTDIVADCPPTEQRIIRFVGEGKGAPGATLFITCSGD